jgi:hypothetical protein
MAIVVQGIVGAAVVLADIPTHWWRKRMTEAFV